MEKRLRCKKIAQTVIDQMYDHINEVTVNEAQAIAVLSQIKILLK